MPTSAGPEVALPPLDAAYLEERAIPHTISSEGGMTCVVLPGWILPAGLSRPAADLLVRLPAGYPDVAPDMWWFSPDVCRADGQLAANTNVTERHLGRDWQRLSRHFQAGQWRSGIDGLESYLALIRHDLSRAAT
jgi:hypothetical protein